MNISLKKKILYLTSSLLIISALIPSSSHEETPAIEEITLEDGTESFIYSRGTVYIIKSRNDFKKIKDTLIEGDIVVVDERNTIDPNMVIMKSYETNESEIMREVLNILLTYENNHPSEWNRTLESMLFEWKVHNYLYYFNYEETRTRDVDLNNDDEVNYSSKILMLFLNH